MTHKEWGYAPRIAAEGDGKLHGLRSPHWKFSTVLPGRVPIVNVMQDREGLVWLAAGSDGLVLFHPLTRTTTRFVHMASDTRSLSEGYVQAIIQDSSGRIWVGAGNAVNLWDSATTGPPPDTPTLRSRPHASASPCVPTGRGRLWTGVSRAGGIRSSIRRPDTSRIWTRPTVSGARSLLTWKTSPTAKSFSPGHME